MGEESDWKVEALVDASRDTRRAAMRLFPALVEKLVLLITAMPTGLDEELERTNRLTAALGGESDGSKT